MIDIIKPMIKKFIPFAQKRMGFDMPPRLFIKQDSENANDPLGKTAFYDPGNKSITLYTIGRHPKDVMRSLSHELVHHTQNCRGDFDNTEEMGEGYAQNDEHLREMEREAYEVGNMCFRDWEDSIKSTIYFEHLQKGDKKMSTKDWKNKELTTLLSEAWGFKFNSLEEFNEFNGNGELQAEGEEELEELAQAKQAGDRRKPHKREPVRDEEDDKMDEANVEEGEEVVAEGDEEEEVVEEGVFSPNHYCVHHGGVERNGSVEMAEAVNHNFDQELGKVTHYDMKFEDGTIMEGVPFEDIQVTNASLAEGHKHPPGKRDDEDDEDIDEIAAKRAGNEDRDQGRDRMHADRMHENDGDELKEAIKALLSKHLKG